ncbi:hypothetical protein [Streptomyces sp. NPDC004528]|uniref:hypothetical protein n=1 Tax=Streptomyces sp. NPDC004528 TaxID=3154550 RepID=UPI0033B8C812
MSGIRWQLGGARLEVDPMRSYGGANPSGSWAWCALSKEIRMSAEDFGVTCSTVRDCP